MKVMIYDTGIGLIPFLQKIIKKKKYNDYYLYMDEDAFPIGTRSKEYIIEHLKFIINYATGKFDILIIACNSLSSYLDYIDLSKYKIKVYSIFKENLKLLNDDVTFLGTSASISNLNTKYLVALDSLPYLIENNKVKDIINLVSSANIKTKYAILGCTHFPLIEFIFKDLYPDVTFISNEDKIIDDLSSDTYFRVRGNKKTMKYLNIYFKKSNKILCP